jgi:hypothetical protein
MLNPLVRLIGHNLPDALGVLTEGHQQKTI